METEATEVNPTSLCEVCGLKKFRYTCPACKKKTCSVTCSKAHKEQTGCSGIKSDDPVFLPLSEMNDDTLLTDFHFLTKQTDLVQDSRFTYSRLKRPKFVIACQKDKELKEKFKQFRPTPNTPLNQRDGGNQKHSRARMARRQQFPYSSVLTDVQDLEATLPDDYTDASGMFLIPFDPSSASPNALPSSST